MSTRAITRLLARSLLAMVFFESSGTAMTAENLMPTAVESVTVTAQVYSGRENPSWVLVGKDKDEAVARVSEFVSRAQASDLQPLQKLGYSGLTIVFASQTGRVTVAIGGGVAILTRDDRVYRFSDTDRSLETWFARASADRLEPAVREHMLNSLPK